jgi:hypothetical protein
MYSDHAQFPTGPALKKMFVRYITYIGSITLMSTYMTIIICNSNEVTMGILLLQWVEYSESSSLLTRMPAASPSRLEYNDYK